MKCLKFQGYRERAAAGTFPLHISIMFLIRLDINMIISEIFIIKSKLMIQVS